MAPKLFVARVAKWPHLPVALLCFLTLCGVWNFAEDPRDAWAFIVVLLDFFLMFSVGLLVVSRLLNESVTQRFRKGLDSMKEFEAKREELLAQLEERRRMEGVRASLWAYQPRK